MFTHLFVLKTKSVLFVRFSLFPPIFLNGSKMRPIREKVILSAGDTGFIQQLRMELEAQDCEVQLADKKNGILKEIHDFTPTLLILGIEGVPEEAFRIVRVIREEEDLENLPIFACIDNPKMIKWEDRTHGDPTIVVSKSFISAYISDVVELKRLFDS